MCSWHVWKLPGVLGCFSSLCEYFCVFMEDTVGEDRDLCPFSGFFRQIWLARCWQLSPLLHTICLPFLMLIFLPLYTLFNLYFSSMHFSFLSFKPLLSKSHPSFSPDNTLLIPAFHSPLLSLFSLFLRYTSYFIFYFSCFFSLHLLSLLPITFHRHTLHLLLPSWASSFPIIFLANFLTSLFFYSFYSFPILSWSDFLLFLPLFPYLTLLDFFFKSSLFASFLLFSHPPASFTDSPGLCLIWVSLLLILFLLCKVRREEGGKPSKMTENRERDDYN